ncbi:MAG: hypothetical protein Kow00105_05750 [Phycisphaeraceae bacterium]
MTEVLWRSIKLGLVFMASAVGCLLSAVSPAKAEIQPSQVLVLYNPAVSDSVAIAEYYAQWHPGVDLLPVFGVSGEEEISEEHYLNVIRPQVLAGLRDETAVIATTRGLPLRIYNDTPNPGTYDGWRGEAYGMSIPNGWWKPYSSLESELTRINRISTAEEMGDQGYYLSPPSFNFADNHQAANPYYASSSRFDVNDPANEGMYLTSRLDGFAVDDVLRSINRAQHAYLKPAYQYAVVDDDPDAPGSFMDRMGLLVNEVLTPANLMAVHDTTDDPMTDAPGQVYAYVSHGSHAAGKGYIDDLSFTPAPGAVFHTYESFNAYSFEAGNNRYGQGLIGQWLALGGTAGLGHVEEPKAQAGSIADESILFDRLLRGFTFAEAAWAATSQLSYVNTVVGDPLMTLRPWVPGDVNHDGLVNLVDLNILLACWEEVVGEDDYDHNDADLNGDGWIGFQDLNIVLTNWSKTGPASATIIPAPGSAWLILLLTLLMLFSRPGTHGRVD